MLMSCPECREKISSKAVFCVRCGFPLREMYDHHKEYPMECYFDDTWHDLTQTYDEVMAFKEETGLQQSSSLSPEQVKKLHNLGFFKTEKYGFKNNCKEIKVYIYDLNKVPAFYLLPIKTAPKPNNTPVINTPVIHTPVSQPNVVTCPLCGSTNVKKIGTISKAGSVGMFGLASSKIGKQWHCNNCRSDF